MDTQVETKYFTVVREVLCSNYWSHDLIGPYHFWGISPRILLCSPRPFEHGLKFARLYGIAGNIGGLKIWWFCSKSSVNILAKFKFGSGTVQHITSHKHCVCIYHGLLPSPHFEELEQNPKFTNLWLATYWCQASYMYSSHRGAPIAETPPSPLLSR